MNRTETLDVQQVKAAILTFASRHGVTDVVFMQALAEMTGMAAYMLDRNEGVHSFDKRMEAFTDHARAIYQSGPPARALAHA